MWASLCQSATSIALPRGSQESAQFVPDAGAARQRQRSKQVPPPPPPPSSTAQAAAGLALAAALLLGTPPPQAEAYNVRLENVESDTMRAGLRAATEGRLEEAERFFQIYLLQEDPSSASAYSNLGNVHQQQERPELAVEDYTRAVELAPEVGGDAGMDWAGCRKNRPAAGEVPDGGQRWQSAQAPVPYLNRAISKETLGVRAAEEGDRLGALALWRSAAADCDAAIERDVAEFAAWFDRGNIRMRLEDWGGALTDFRTAADLAPGLAGYRLREATLLFQQGDATAAQRMMAGIVRKNGNYSEAHAALAAVEWARGEGERAEEQFVRALAQERWWGDMPFIRANTRWPPALYDAMERFLAAPAAGAA